MEHENTKKTMTPQQQFEHIVAKILKEFKNEEYYFHDPVMVKTSPHTHPLYLWAIQIDPKGGIWLRDSDGDWAELKCTDRNFEVVVASLYQRITYLFGHQKVA